MIMSDQLAHPSNPDLKGHKLVLVRHQPAPLEWLEKIRKKYPGLEVAYHQVKSFTDADVPASIWENVTAICSYNVFPTREQAPKLQYVQLSSAGANHLHGNPLYEETDIAFCTANGVHP